MPVQCTCRRCGVVFAVPPSKAAAGGLYCSWACRRSRVERVCARCGITFMVQPNLVAKGHGIYCSHACTLTRVERTCAVCGATTIKKARQVDGNVYCSPACFYASRHGEARRGIKSPEYRAWHNMKMRCLKPNNPGYHWYGGRGITVCDRWRDSFEAFLADVGRRPSPLHSIDRVDVNGNYEPGNVRWATATEQSVNRRNVRFLTFDDETRPVAEWARMRGLSPSMVSERLKRGWSPERALMPHQVPDPSAK